MQGFFIQPSVSFFFLVRDFIFGIQWKPVNVMQYQLKVELDLV